MRARLGTLLVVSFAVLSVGACESFDVSSHAEGDDGALPRTRRSKPPRT